MYAYQFCDVKVAYRHLLIEAEDEVVALGLSGVIRISYALLTHHGSIVYSKHVEIHFS